NIPRVNSAAFYFNVNTAYSKSWARTSTNIVSPAAAATTTNATRKEQACYRPSIPICQVYSNNFRNFSRTRYFYKDTCIYNNSTWNRYDLRHYQEKEIHGSLVNSSSFGSNDVAASRHANWRLG